MFSEKLSLEMNLPLNLTGKVVKGFGRGSRELGIPTANIEFEKVKDLILENGVYYGLCQINVDKRCANYLIAEKKSFFKQQKDILVSKVFMMCCNLGYNPFYNNKEKSLEVHVIEDIGMDLYDCSMNVLICDKIRDEQNFDSLDALINAIHNDIQITKEKLCSPEWSKVWKNENFLVLDSVDVF
ncbi:riboflavin kinase [Brevipalpus obovatus]|uniref:riboflavin kinase n=1 Tax=Brevipalpus obovatus TaxID=246614 RepID=UPI003D9FAEF1